MKSRRKFTAEFKAKVAIEALKERESITELAKRYNLHPNQITNWKREFSTKASLVVTGNEKWFFVTFGGSFIRYLKVPLSWENSRKLESLQQVVPF